MDIDRATFGWLLYGLRCILIHGLSILMTTLQDNLVNKIQQWKLNVQPW